MVRKKMSERSNGECIGTVCLVGVFSLIANIIMPLPTGLLPVFVGFGIILIFTFIYLAVRGNPYGSSGSSGSFGSSGSSGSFGSSGSNNTESNTINIPIKKSRILCIKCNSPVESDQEFCPQCGHHLK